MPRPSVAGHGDRVDCGRREARDMMCNIHTTYAVLNTTDLILEGGDAGCGVAGSLATGELWRGLGWWN